MALTLTQLRYFCELAETGHFGRAAERLHMSQPPLSRQIALMEAQLGTDLFRRSPKGVVLTPAGQQLLNDGREVLRLAALAERNALAARSGEVGHLAVGFTMCAAYSVVPGLARRYKSSFPRVELRVREMMPTVLEQALLHGDIDIAISFPGLDGPQVRTQALLREPMDLVLPLHHRLARARRVRMQDLAEESFIIVPRDQAPPLHDAVMQRCQAAGFSPRIGLEVYLQQTIVNFVAEGLGVALVPSSMQKARVQGTVFKTVDEPPMIDQMALWRPSNPNPCIAAFLDGASAG